MLDEGIESDELLQVLVSNTNTISDDIRVV